MQGVEGPQVRASDRLGAFDHCIGKVQDVEKAQQLMCTCGRGCRDTVRRADKFHPTDHAGDAILASALIEPTCERG